MSNADKLKFAKGAFCAWLALLVSMMIIWPFLPMPIRLYVGHASMILLFGGIGVAILAVKIWIAPFMPGRNRPRTESQPEPDRRALAGNRRWTIFTVALAPLGMIVMPLLGIHLTRDQIYAASLGVAVIAICGYYAVRRLRGLAS